MDFLNKVNTTINIITTARSLGISLWKLKDAAAESNREAAEIITIEINGYRDELKTLVAAL